MKMVGSARRPPGPKAGDAEAALHLMIALGGKDEKALRYMEDLQAAIEHNEKLISDIAEQRAALSTLQQREKVLIENEARVDAKLSELQVIRESFKIYDADYNA